MVLAVKSCPVCGITELRDEFPCFRCSDMPRRIQRKRTKGWRLPPNTICVDRTTRFGNPFVVGKDGTAAECVKKYGEMLLPYTHAKGTLEDFYLSSANVLDIESLRGKNLACWCALDQPCHADVLLEIANLPEDTHDHPKT